MLLQKEVYPAVMDKTAEAIDRMALAAARDSLPDNGMFNGYQLDAMAEERMPTYRRIATVMFLALIGGERK